VKGEGVFLPMPYFPVYRCSLGRYIAMEKKDYYIILGVSRSESGSGIHKAFRNLAITYHPGRVGPKGTRRFQDITEAYRVLSDPQKRKDYNKSLHHAEEEIKIEPRSVKTYERTEPEPLFPEPISVMRDFQAVRPSFEEMFDRLVRNFTEIRVPKGECIKELNVEVILTPDEASMGGIVFLAVPVFYTCPFCGGSGQDCLFPCIHCCEQGIVEDEETVKIRISAMVKDGTIYEITLKSLGIHNFHLRVHVRIDTR